MAIISNAVTIADAGAFSVGLGAMTLIKSLRASNAGTLSFVHGASSVVLDGTYPIYMFRFVEIHPAELNKDFTFNMSIDSGSNYNIAKTSTVIEAYHSEDNSGAGLGYHGSYDLAQGTGFQSLANAVGNNNDDNFSGELLIYSPSSTTFVKHFMSKGSHAQGGGTSSSHTVAGYGNTTSAVNAIQFKFTSGNIESGKVQLYGIKDS